MANDFLFDDLIEKTGYRLSVFELYNWGTFDNRIIHMELGGENSLLTGSNGSGKTTIVDAVLTLLVPMEYVSYNISSGKDGRDGRTMDSYVRGAWSTHKEDDQFSASKDYLRDKTTHSILLGTFINAGAEKPITLLQIHYYNQSGTLQHLYALFDQAITIRQLQTTAGVFNPANLKAYKASLSEHFGQGIQFFETFRSYSKVFGERVGFRSREKALKIFSKTVGMKDLTNLNEFIRYHMLDEVDFEAEFKNLSESYVNLHNTQIEIEKDDEQIRQLRRILSEGQRFGEKTLEYGTAKKDQDFCELWKAWQSKSFLEFEIDKCRAERSLVVGELTEKQLAQESQEARKDELRDQLNQNEQYRQLEAKRNTLGAKQLLLQERRSTREFYAARVRKIDLQMPFDDNGFEANLFSLASKQHMIEDRNESLQENINVSTMTRQDLEKQLSVTEEQLQALAGRDSNIPLQYLQERSGLCEWLGVEESELPFAGELMQVKEEYEAQRKSIELLLHDFALTLLIPHSLRNKVGQYLWANQVKVSIAYVAIPKEQFLPADDDSEDILCGTIEVKEGHPYSSWVFSHLQQAFKHVHVQSLDELLHTELAYSDRQLTRDGVYFKAHAIPKKSSDIYVLGWDTARKREQLVVDKDNLVNAMDDLDRAIREDSREIARNKEKIEAIIEIRTIRTYEAINTRSPEAEIEELNAQIADLELSLGDYDALRKQLQQVDASIRELKARCEHLVSERGRIDGRLGQYEEMLKYRTELLKEVDVDARHEEFSEFSERYGLSNVWSNLDNLDEAADKIRRLLDDRIQQALTDINDSKDRCINLMSSFCKPSQDTLTKYPNWTSNLLELGTDSFSMQDIPAFRKVYDHLLQDDLPRHKEEFANYRTSLIGKDVISFNRTLMNWQRTIDENIVDLNTSLQRINYSQDPVTRAKTHIRIRKQQNADDMVRNLKALLRAAMPNPTAESNLTIQQKLDVQNKFFRQVEALLSFLRQDDVRQKVLDVRRWFIFAAEEYDVGTGDQLRYYQDSAGISGGQKAKLAYTIFAAAIAKQFDVFSDDGASRSFRFVLIDEAFSKIDDENSRYAMQLFSQLNLQLMVITPLDKGNLVLPFIKTVHVTECPDGRRSQIVSVKVEDFDGQR
ncbi:MAG: SbcC/MukB-like Walker B domain-containing protein [Sphaerochaetaceae bacterium]|nr:SbcC/MukB-like Walker B domain-containing protein [Sphaerochaetaceae bacterium]